MNNKPPTTVRKKDDGQFDLEQQFILRMPPGPAMALRHDIQSGAMNLKDKLALEIGHDMRHSKITYGGQVMNAKLLDLPTIIESHKTVDRKTLYKTADVSQMLICVSDEEDSVEDADTKKKDKKNQFPHGITPPLKNVRKRRFRKTLRKKDQPDIEKEVKRLFRMDNEAIDVKWEVVEGDEKPQEADRPEKPNVIMKGESHGRNIIENNLLDVALFGEVSDSEEEDEKEVNIMDSDEDASTSRLMDTSGGAGAGSGLDQYPTSGFPGADLQMTDSMMSAEGDASADLQDKLHEVKQQLGAVRERRMTREMELAVTDDDQLKDQLKDEIEGLAGQDNRMQQECEIISSMLNQ